MRVRRSVLLVGAVALATVLTLPPPAAGQSNPVTLDPKKGTLEGSPVDHLPENIRLLDIQLPDGGKPMRPDWSPDGQRLVFLDAPMGDVWEHDLTTGANRNLTETFLPGGVLRVHHLSNGDVILCAPAEPSAEDPEGDRFRGTLWVLQQPLGRAPVSLGESCWEGIAVSRQAGSTLIAWNQSTINFTDFPNVFIEALVGESNALTGRIVYGTDGTPTIADRTVVLGKHDVSPDTPAVEAQDFRSLDDGDADPDDELIFTAYFHNGGQAMGLDLDTGAFERLTTFDYYRGYGANNPVVSPDGTLIAFSLKVEGEEGEGDGILLLHLTVPAAAVDTPAPPATPAAPAPVEPLSRSVTSSEATAQLPATGSETALTVAGALVALAVLFNRTRRAPGL